VRKAVEARDKPQKAGRAHLVIWAAYCLVCIPAYDFIPRYGGIINLAGMMIAGVVSVLMGKREGIKAGQYDRAALMRIYTHFFGGALLVVLTVAGLASLNRGMGDQLAGQVSVILVGFMYFFGGIHIPHVKFMRWIGPIIIAAGIGLSRVPHYQWSVMACIYAVCILSPVIFGKRQSMQS
jgi:hypothetical protein